MEARKRFRVFTPAKAFPKPFATFLIAFCLAATCGSASGTPTDGGTSAPPKASSASAKAHLPASTELQGSLPGTTAIPGPLPSFLRMAGVSQQVQPDEVLPLLARNVVIHGYSDNKPTEYLLLLNRYLEQAKELLDLAGPGRELRVTGCDDAKPLLEILGYKVRPPCGANVSLETADGNRAFVTIDSAFPLSQLEDALRAGRPFVLSYTASQIPALFNEQDWNLQKRSRLRNAPAFNLVQVILHDPDLARLYWSLSGLDVETATDLRDSRGLTKLMPYAPVLDFYGSFISIRNGHALVPGGAAAEPAWKNLVGASPQNGAEFVMRLLEKDDGWPAVYLDALFRASPQQQAYFTDPARLQRFYQALRVADIAPNPARHAFRPDESLVLLVSRIQFDSNGQPHVPGDLEVWKDLLRRKSDSKVLRAWSGRAARITTPDALIEAMVGLTRSQMKDGPVQCFVMMSELDSVRPDRKLSPKTIAALAGRFPQLSDQYLVFSEFGRLDDASVSRFLSVVDGINRVQDRLLRADTLGLLQANEGIWEILARQHQIPDDALNDSWQKMMTPFVQISSSAQLFEAGKTSLQETLRAATGRPMLSQDAILALLAGPDVSSAQAQPVRQAIANRMRAVLDDQRLVSLDVLFALDDGITKLAQGESVETGELVSLAGELREFELPKPLFTSRERSEYAFGLYSSRHTAAQMHTDLTKIIRSPLSGSQLSEARAELTPFLRDTLVGLNYAYYEPPGAQMLHNNPLFVRTHDFSGGNYSGQAATAQEQTWHTPQVFGRGLTASSGAHLVGSLADLPYVLASVEQDFIVPANVQSLIWEDMAPSLLTSAVLPRWWGISRNELHAVALYQRAGEELLVAAAQNEDLRHNVMDILSRRMLPKRSLHIETILSQGHADDAVAQILPAEAFYLTAEFRQRFPDWKQYWGPAGKELDSLIQSDPAETNPARLSQDFGVPHPALAFTYARSLMDLQPVPTFMGYSSRLLAETWDSNNLYWARLADEMGYSPEVLNQIVPELTEHMVGAIFASNLEDWPAVLRAMHETGDEFRHGKVAALPKHADGTGL